jgi:2-amino-4-hydroxy-6-hydroxymethyldihydropteridine diphosphokinase
LIEPIIHTVYLGLGSNLGDSRATILMAYREIEKLIGTIVRQSAFYVSEPWGFSSPNQFVNSVVCVHTSLSPHALLKQTQTIERLLGKNSTHATERTAIPSPLYHDRPIDIDILLYDDLHIDTPELKIPHPLMQERDFVMIPLSEIGFTYADPEP